MTCAFILSIWLALNLWIFTSRILAPNIRARMFDARWAVPHPGMSIDRQVHR
jgi:hypothetical protein